MIKKNVYNSILNYTKVKLRRYEILHYYLNRCFLDFSIITSKNVSFITRTRCLYSHMLY